VLERFVAARVPQAAMHRLHRLPLAVVEQRVQILTGRRVPGTTIDAVGELIGKLSEPSQQWSSRALRHAQKRMKVSTLGRSLKGPAGVRQFFQALPRFQ
jgi:hypothetical protein